MSLEAWEVCTPYLASLDVVGWVVTVIGVITLLRYAFSDLIKYVRNKGRRER